MTDRFYIGSDGREYESGDWDDADPDAECTWCHGDGWEECDDPIQCTKRHIGGSPFDGGEHECSACGGSGKAEDQTL